MDLGTSAPQGRPRVPAAEVPLSPATVDSVLSNMQEVPRETLAEKLKRLCCCKEDAVDVVQNTISKRNRQQEAGEEQGTGASLPVNSPQPHETPAPGMQAALLQCSDADVFPVEVVSTAAGGSTASAVAMQTEAVSSKAQDLVGHAYVASVLAGDKAEQVHVLQPQQQLEIRTAQQLTQQHTARAMPKQQPARQQLLPDPVTQQQLIQQHGLPSFSTCEGNHAMESSSRTSVARRMEVSADYSSNSNISASIGHGTDLQAHPHPTNISMPFLSPSMFTAHALSNKQLRPEGHYLPPLPHTPLPNQESFSASQYDERHSAGMFAPRASAHAHAEAQAVQALPEVRLHSPSVLLHASSSLSETIVVELEDKEELLLANVRDQGNQLLQTGEASKGCLSPVVTTEHSLPHTLLSSAATSQKAINTDTLITTLPGQATSSTATCIPEHNTLTPKPRHRLVASRKTIQGPDQTPATQIPEHTTGALQYITQHPKKLQLPASQLPPVHRFQPLQQQHQNPPLTPLHRPGDKLSRLPPIVPNKQSASIPLGTLPVLPKSLTGPTSEGVPSDGVPCNDALHGSIHGAAAQEMKSDERTTHEEHVLNVADNLCFASNMEQPSQMILTDHGVCQTEHPDQNVPQPLSPTAALSSQTTPTGDPVLAVSILGNNLGVTSLPQTDSDVPRSAQQEEQERTQKKTLVKKVAVSQTLSPQLLSRLGKTSGPHLGVAGLLKPITGLQPLQLPPTQQPEEQLQQQQEQPPEQQTEEQQHLQLQQSSDSTYHSTSHAATLVGATEAAAEEHLEGQPFDNLLQGNGEAN